MLKWQMSAKTAITEQLTNSTELLSSGSLQIVFLCIYALKTYPD